MSSIRYLFCVFFLIGSIIVYGQNIGINEDGAAPHASAILHIQATNKGLLVPRMTSAQRVAVPSPATGLMVFDTNTNGFWFFNGTVWVPLLSGSISGNTLNQAYNQGGAGAGRTITADAGAVRIAGVDGFLVTGTAGSGANVEISGGGTRMFFNPRTGAFRAGAIDGTQWNQANLGLNSFATGNSTFAADYAVAMGNYSRAEGFASVAMGEFSISEGAFSVALGANATAIGESAIAIGESATADGDLSVAFSQGSALGGNSIAHGQGVFARSGYEVAIGRFNTTYVPVSSGGFNVNDRVFVVGNGTSNILRSNALTVMKNGNIGMGTDDPQATLHVDGQIRYEDGSEGAGKTLISDASGNSTWSGAIGFSAHRTSVAFVNSTLIVFNAEDHDIGNNYNTTTGIFTVPYSGLYSFDYIEYSSAASGSSVGIRVIKNGSTERHYTTLKTATNLGEAISFSWTMLLDSGDTVNLEGVGASRNLMGTSTNTTNKTRWEGTWVK